MKKAASTSNHAETEPLNGPNLEIIPSISSSLHDKLQEMTSAWGKLRPCPSKDHGLQVFQKLLQMPFKSLATFEVKFSKKGHGGSPPLRFVRLAETLFV